MTQNWRPGYLLGLVFYGLFLWLGLTQDRTALLWAAFIALWQTSLAITTGGWRPWSRLWPRTEEERK